jgi:flavorubredoxin
MTMTRWIANAMEEIMYTNDLFHCAFCEKAKHADDQATCVGPEDICLDCHEYDCPAFYTCLMERNFA